MFDNVQLRHFELFHLFHIITTLCLFVCLFVLAAQQEIEKVRALDKEIDVLQTSNQECEKLNKELDSEISRLEQRLTVCKEETASDR